MRTLILDNFDSFTYNLYQYLAELGANPEVYRNNEITVEEIEKKGYTHIVISPGPGSPVNKKDFGVCGEAIKHFASRVPILGVCLGHQGIIHALGGRIIRAPLPMHGKRSVIMIKNCAGLSLFKNLPEKFEAMRYHSLIGERKTLPKDLMVTAETEDKIIMAVQHKKFPLYGVQFHPESVGTPLGKEILKNFLRGQGENGEIRNRMKSIDLSKKQAEQLLYKMAAGKMTDDRMADELRILANKGESVSEIIGMARGMRKLAVKLPKITGEVMDTCGTGGSGLPRMNISTTAAFVLASAGVKIAKHGNRAASGRCGSFDLLENLGVNIELPPFAVARAINELDIGFIFAPMFHPAIKRIAPVRKKLGIRTIFNLLGPLTNPAKPAYHLLGTTSPFIAEKMIEAMKGLGLKHAMVVCGEDGLDDITLTGKTKIFELTGGKMKKFEFTPEEAGMKCVKNFSHIAGGDAKKNAQIFTQLLKGKGPKNLQNLLLLNAAFGFMVRGMVKTAQQGIALAGHAIQSGAAYEKFLAYKNFSLQFGAFNRAIRGKEKIKVIAELKRRSPSFGNFPAHDVKTLVAGYEKSGAAALSVVTEPKLFKGSIALLEEMRKISSLPILRKDFITTIRQIEQSSKAGASAILLIARILSKKKLIQLVVHAKNLGLDPVVEIHTKYDLEKIEGLNNIIVGINNRDLKNFKTDVRHARSLIDRVPAHFPVIVESGFKNRAELNPYRGKADAVLIGTSLLISKNPSKTLSTFTC